MVFFITVFILGGCSTQAAEESVVESSNSATQSSEEIMAESVAVESSVVTESFTQEDEDTAPVSEEAAAIAEK